MSKDFVQTANDVVTGVGLLRRGAPDTIKAFSTLSAAATASCHRRENEGTHGARDRHRSPLRRLRRLSREEVVETVALAVYMGGGPAAVYGGDALRA